jgi:hypothetical protein
VARLKEIIWLSRRYAQRRLRNLEAYRADRTKVYNARFSGQSELNLRVGSEHAARARYHQLALWVNEQHRSVTGWLELPPPRLAEQTRLTLCYSEQVAIRLTRCRARIIGVKYRNPQHRLIICRKGCNRQRSNLARPCFTVRESRFSIAR